ncbi:hypothetical protein [Methylocapsa sp. S129]|uniref:hypothetical protein n=1 Tax=Methylocapsa sp. S129 TaxID=1641869 RepID=UPI00131E5700|nr:hypothetical protein [Methylocapsa sp. S129]
MAGKLPLPLAGEGRARAFRRSALQSAIILAALFPQIFSPVFSMLLQIFYLGRAFDFKGLQAKNGNLKFLEFRRPVAFELRSLGMAIYRRNGRE